MSTVVVPKAVIVGAGGHAKVVIDLMRAEARFDLIGLISGETRGSRVNGVEIIASDEDLPRLRREGVSHALVAIGDNARRLQISRALEAMGFELANAISPAAVISPSAMLGRGIAIMAGAVVNSESRLDDICIINTRASIDHDGHIGEAAHIAPGCALAGNVSVGRLAFLGVGSSVIPGQIIGEGAVVGAGSCVVRAIPPHSKAYGVPARVVASPARELP